MWVCVYVCVRECTRVCVSVCECVCMCVCVPTAGYKRSQRTSFCWHHHIWPAVQIPSAKSLDYSEIEGESGGGGEIEVERGESFLATPHTIDLEPGVEPSNTYSVDQSHTISYGGPHLSTSAVSKRDQETKWPLNRKKIKTSLMASLGLIDPTAQTSSF